MDEDVVKRKKKKCNLCLSSENDEVSFGHLYTLEDVTVHYFCVVRYLLINEK